MGSQIRAMSNLKPAFAEILLVCRFFFVMDGENKSVPFFRSSS
jgi:hypothetical protein